eukprot:TRINITY_DN1549_c1_g1_i1.p1 TRINITY_DN1549_c1_g1~~TRINITY_DN1549_c1_g1_i1.p1  ORF type:complete len:274 (+),score=31.09 TRINITY_DN1549_c1_g1_i1:49-870(+)
MMGTAMCWLAMVTLTNAGVERHRQLSLLGHSGDKTAGFKKCGNPHIGDGSYVSCVGDSITQGLHTVTYPAMVKKILKDEYGFDVKVKNYGVSGRTGGVSKDWYRKTREFRSVQNHVSNVTLLMLGTNDGKEGVHWKHWGGYSFVTGLSKLLDPLLKKSSYLAFVTPVPAYSTVYKIQPSAVTTCVLPAIRSFAASHHLPLIDAYSPLESRMGHPYAHSGPFSTPCIKNPSNLLTGDPPKEVVTSYKKYYQDGVHLNTAGQKLLARIIVDHLCG